MSSTVIRSRGFVQLLLIPLSLLLLNVALYRVLPAPRAFARDQALAQAVYCFNFDHGPGERGWHGAERGPDGTAFCWTSESSSQLRSPLMEAGSDYRLEVKITEGITRSHVDALRFTLDGAPLSMIVEHRVGGTLFSTVLPKTLFQRPRSCLLGLWTKEPLRPRDLSGSHDTRRLGVRVSSVRLLPCQGLRWREAAEGRGEAWTVQGDDIFTESSPILGLTIREPFRAAPVALLGGTPLRMTADAAERSLWHATIDASARHDVALRLLTRDLGAWLYRPDRFRSALATLPTGADWSEPWTDERGRTYRRPLVPQAALRMLLAPPAVVRVGVLTANEVLDPLFKPLHLFPPRPVVLALTANGYPVALRSEARPASQVLEGLLPGVAGPVPQRVEMLFSTDAGPSRIGPAISWIEVVAAPSAPPSRD